MKTAYPSTPATLAAVSILALCLTIDAQAGDVDADAAQAFAKQNKCLTCHGIDKEKAGPAWKDVAAKLKGQPDAEAKLINHITSGERGHAVVKSDDASAIKNLVDWILSL